MLKLKRKASFVYISNPSYCNPMDLDECPHSPDNLVNLIDTFTIDNK